MSQVSSVWQLYLYWGVIVGIDKSGIWVPLLSTVTRWFAKGRSLMTGIVIAGLGIGTFIHPLVVSRLISAYDWRLTYIILGIIILFVLVLASQFLRRAPSQVGQMPYGENKGREPRSKLETEEFFLREAVSTRQFWLVLSMFFCFGFALFAVQVHIVPHVIELGISPIRTANILALMGLLTVVGNFVLGYVADESGTGSFL